MTATDGRDGSAQSPAPATVAQAKQAQSGNRPRASEDIRLPDQRLLHQRTLAAGGMGSVLHVYDLQLQRHIALKVLHAPLAERPDERDAFRREACVTAQLDHPNIVPVHDLYIDDEAPWAGFTMKMVEGQSLEEYLRELGETRLRDAELGGLLDVVLKVCDAVSFAHSRNVLHLDLKPANIMIGGHGQVYVMDWGIAAKCTRQPDGSLRPMQPPRSTRGTLAYMPPEQLDRELRGVDERADVYALGATLYELLTGRPPFLATGGPDDLARKAAHVVPDVPHAADRPGPPPGLMQVALRALAPSPADRYPSVDALKAEIERLRHGGGWLSARSYAPGDVIMAEGEPGDEAYILAEGRCQVFKRVGESDRLLRTLSPGDLFGEMAILTAGQRSATVTAVTRVKVWVVTRQTLLSELGRYAWVGGLVKALADRFLEADNERAALRAELERMQRAR